MKEAASRAESDTRAIRVELASYEKQQFSIQQEINAQITLQKELANHLPQLEEHEAQLVERTQAIETQRIELEKKAAELGAKRSDIDVRYASIRERRPISTIDYLKLKSDSKAIQPNETKQNLNGQRLKSD